MIQTARIPTHFHLIVDKGRSRYSVKMFIIYQDIYFAIMIYDIACRITVTNFIGHLLSESDFSIEG